MALTLEKKSYKRTQYNRALALQREVYERGEKKLGYAGLCRQLTGWRNGADCPWLADAPIHPQQQAFRDLDRAYVNFFEKRAEFPRFKRKGQSSSFRFPDPKQFKLDQPNSRIFLPKLGWVRYRNSRKALGDLRNVTVSCVADKWYVSIQTRRDVEIPVHPSDSAVAIDMGIARFVTLGDGECISPLNSFRKHEKRLAKYQRRMSRKKKFSSNWKKAKARVQKAHHDIANARKDFLHKSSAAISKNHAIVCIEDLQVVNMSKSAEGTVEKPGKKVKQKAGLNRAILDQGWAELHRQLHYKLAWLGGLLVPVPAHNTSRTCPCCEHVSKENRRTQADFECIECGYRNNADVVGASNGTALGRLPRQCGDDARDSAVPSGAGIEIAGICGNCARVGRIRIGERLASRDGGLRRHDPRANGCRCDIPGPRWIDLTELVAVLCGAFMLRGHNWARWVALVWIAFQVVLSAFHAIPELAIHALFCAAIAWILFRPEAERYFRGGRSEAT